MEDRAEKITKYLVWAYSRKGKKQHFFVLDKGEEVECHWKRKNIRGVTFGPDQMMEAEAWVKHALLVGYTVYQSSIKDGNGGGRGLKDWPLPWDWDDELGCWDLNPETVLDRQKKGFRMLKEMGR